MGGSPDLMSSARSLGGRGTSTWAATEPARVARTWGRNLAIQLLPPASRAGDGESFFTHE